MHDSKLPRPAARSIRGMSLAPYQRDGYPVAELTDSKDRCIASVTLVRGIDPSRVRAMFRELLEMSDPVRPRIALVRDDHQD
jgi:hypothetical protein